MKDEKNEQPLRWIILFRTQLFVVDRASGLISWILPDRHL